MADKFKVIVQVVRQRQYQDGPFAFDKSYQDGSLDRVIASLNLIRDSIPEHYRSSARCEFGTETDYDCTNVYVEIDYDRPSTDEEELTRDNAARREQLKEEASERAQYEKLKKKFEPTRA